jgi:hypothetical protein
MRKRIGLTVFLVAVVAVGAAFWIGRASAPRPTPASDPAPPASAAEKPAEKPAEPPASAAEKPAASGTPADRGYAAGVRDGRAEQATVGRPADDKAVFDSGYAAGAADAFGGYDGGWDRGTPYVIVLSAGGPGVTYRIASRTALAPGVDYYLCPDGRTLCHRP